VAQLVARRTHDRKVDKAVDKADAMLTLSSAL